MSLLKKNFLRPYTVLIAVYFFLAAATAVKIGVSEAECSRLIDQIAAKQDLTNVTNMDVNLNVKNLGFLAHFILKLVDPQKSTVAEALQNQRDILVLIQNLKREFLSSADASLALLGFTLLFLVAARGGGENGPETNQRKIYALLSVSLICFALGILCPVLTAVVKGEHVLVGGFIIETTSKGIASTVLTLFKSGNWIIGILLMGFSIGIPLFKGTATVIACLGSSDEKRRKTARLLEAIGKWSLTDVLVAAVLLGCFSLNAFKENTGGIVAVPRFALGFFIIYCVLAARTAYLLKSAVKSPAREKSAKSVTTATAILLGSSLVAGTLFGYFAFANFSYGRELGDIAVVKLVRAHTELLQTKQSIDSREPGVVAFELPFAGTLAVEVKAREQAPLEIIVVSGEADRPAALAKESAVPLTETIDAKAKSDRLTGRISAGKYQLVIRGNFTGEGLQSDTVSIHIALDP